MLELRDVIHQLANKDEINIRGEQYKVKNMVMAADDSVMKLRVILENTTGNDKIELDVGISAIIYRR
jgi:hypothetical protein